jgi:hypothetical protein
MSCRDCKLRFDLRDARLGQASDVGVVDSVGVGRAGATIAAIPSVPAASTVPAIDSVKRLVNIMSGPFRVAPARVAGQVKAATDASRDSQRILGGFM